MFHIYGRILATLAIAFGILSTVNLSKEIPKQGSPPKNLTKQADGHWSPYTASAMEEGASVHIVVKGDTLWDVSKKYLENPYLWPQIWELNTYIKNPHWIYPGDPIMIKQVVVISEESLKKEAAKAAAESAPAPESPSEPVAEHQSRTIKPKKALPLITEHELYCSGFISSQPLDDDLLIIGAEEERYKTRFSQGDIVYLNKGFNEGITTGSEYSVVRPLVQVKDVGNGKPKLGNYIAELGKLRVLMAHDHSATAQVALSCDTIHLGDILRPFEPRESPSAEYQKDASLTVQEETSGHIIFSKHDYSVLGQGHIVHINLGKEAGIKPGDFFTVYSKLRGFGPGGVLDDRPVEHERLREDSPYKLRKKKALKERETHKRLVGEILVFTVQDQTATAKIMNNRQEILVGDTIYLQGRKAWAGATKGN